MNGRCCPVKAPKNAETCSLNCKEPCADGFMCALACTVTGKGQSGPIIVPGADANACLQLKLKASKDDSYSFGWRCVPKSK